MSRIDLKHTSYLTLRKAQHTKLFAGKAIEAGHRVVGEHSYEYLLQYNQVQTYPIADIRASTENTRTMEAIRMEDSLQPKLAAYCQDRFILRVAPRRATDAQSMSI